MHVFTNAQIGNAQVSEGTSGIAKHMGLTLGNERQKIYGIFQYT